MRIQERLERLWWGSERPPWYLVGLSTIYCSVAVLRRAAYRHGLLPTQRIPVPVIVIGNITVGGSGKTPLVTWLARALRERGYHPGIASRGYGGHYRVPVQDVTGDSNPDLVGDEAVLLARDTGCPVAVARARPLAARRLVEAWHCDVVIADDGLQHYSLARDMEVAVVDGKRRHGNGYCLPAGPLRELPARLQAADIRICHGGTPRTGEIRLDLVPDPLEPLASRPQTTAPAAGDRVHAVAGIGNPQRFFNLLRELGLEVIEHPFPDHHRFAPGDLEFGDRLPVIMTAKDAVKCRDWADQHCWVLPVTAQPAAELISAIENRLRERNGGQEAA